MPKFPDLPSFAAAIAPVIDAVHVNVHASARRPPDGLLNDLRYALPLRSVTRHDLATVYRYGDAAEREPAIRAHVREGTLAETDGVLRLTDLGLAAVHELYAAHAAAVARVWPDVSAPAALVGRVLDEARRDPGGALAVMAPPYEPEGTPPGVLLFNRLAALRYHRADCHAAAWQAEGLSAAEIVALRPGPLRDRVEAATNRRAARPYALLTDEERATLYGDLLNLV
ncbi:hypothetical protein [Nonomuraea sp. SBT364]|uniref:hypothetical protein n=1 Tax=Nonomuraea sp. SBT364 TaxID=1580530 RepID=UPI00069EEE85|nr:hypothetical protein [Nonomuraea sp. SBT364]